MIKLKEAVIVEGKYDKIRLGGLIDAVIIETGGFRIFRDKEKMRLIRTLAEKNGIIVLTDSDSAGFMIRGKLSSCIPKTQIKHAYIPDILGKERRKRFVSKEGKLGVEGMETAVLEKVLQEAGIRPQPERRLPKEKRITKADLYEWGITGKPESRQKRQRLLAQLGLPEHMTTNLLLSVLHTLYTKEELLDLALWLNK